MYAIDGRLRRVERRPGVIDADVQDPYTSAMSTDYRLMLATLRASRRGAAAELRSRGLSYRSIARRLGVAIGTVQSDLRRTAGPDAPSRPTPERRSSS